MMQQSVTELEMLARARTVEQSAAPLTPRLLQSSLAIRLGRSISFARIRQAVAPFAYAARAPLDQEHAREHARADT